MRTGKVILSGTLFFAYYKDVVFYTHGDRLKSFVCLCICHTFAMSIRDNKAPKSMIALIKLIINLLNRNDYDKFKFEFKKRECS